MAKRRVGLRGRAVVALVLVIFLAVTTSVVWRRSLGSVQARRLQQLSGQVTVLQGERAKLERDVQRITSRPYLTPLVARLGLGVPSDSQVIVLPARSGPGR
jgi:hypothetical protein